MNYKEGIFNTIMSIKKRTIIDSSEVESKLINEGKLSSKKGKDYVNSKDLLEEFKLYHVKLLAAQEKGLPPPKLSDKIGLAIMQIATRRCNSRNYVGYTNNWKEEMIDHAIMVCATKAHKFDPINYSNPFAYITQIADNAIKEQIKLEKKQTYIRYKMYDETKGMYADLSDENINAESLEQISEIDDMYKNRLEYISDYEERNFNKKKDEPDEDEESTGIYAFI